MAAFGRDLWKPTSPAPLFQQGSRLPGAASSRLLKLSKDGDRRISPGILSGVTLAAPCPLPAATGGPRCATLALLTAKPAPRGDGGPVRSVPLRGRRRRL